MAAAGIYEEEKGGGEREREKGREASGI